MPDKYCLSLQALADLFALSRIQADLLFRNDDYVAGEKAKAIQKLIESLCKELRNVAVPLVSPLIRFCHNSSASECNYRARHACE